jgi:hypothetical protein
MKNLIEYINEGLLKGQDATIASGEADIKKVYVEDFINSIYCSESNLSGVLGNPTGACEL